MPDLNLCLFGGMEFWIELKAGTKDPLIRPAQYAWATRRAARGGIVLCLHRFHGNPWFLYDMGSASYQPAGSKLRLTGDPLAVGYTTELLNLALIELWNKKHNS